ncbi:hypothetical protein F5X71_29555 [Nocardia brasiliensis]|uniref:Zinc finger CHC2-type domain-containing protein n=1 Tax=Nocardia brasiliensis TaxID=37326 RepID=A0A6G9XYK7_NOCBR|nr:hypothetical protein F5X71_29555 [Nocardia brasiliensis]
MGASIAAAIQRYFPGWEPPEDWNTYNKTLCPFHGETRPSASISFEHNRFHCFACGVSGDAIDIIRSQEDMTFAAAQRLAAELSPGGDDPVRESVPQQPSRRIFGRPGPDRSGSRGPGPVSARVRRRSAPWA